MTLEHETVLPARGTGRSMMRVVACKDCRREIRALEARVAAERAAGADVIHLERELDERVEGFVYNEHWAQGRLDRGESRSDRCEEHRRSHRSNIQGIAVAHIDLRTIGAVRDPADPRGPLGGLGPMPALHEARAGDTDLSAFEFGMTDADIVDILEHLRTHRVLILKAGTGTGKSTFAPYRLMDPPTTSDLAALRIAPPPNGVFDLAGLGPIVVTEPRVQAATGVATFVGTRLSGAGGVGAGFPVGYQVKGDRNHNDACQLVYVTDGTMINWLREGRLSRIGTVIVDEAHERSTNIDFIIGFLKRNLHNYPHLRVIVTSATFDEAFYQEYFGGPGVAAVQVVDPVKTIGYGMPLFPDLDDPLTGDTIWPESAELPLREHGAADEVGFAERHWPVRDAPPLGSDEVVDPGDVGWIEDLHATTRALLPLRFTGEIPIGQWKQQMPTVLGDFVVGLVRGLDAAGIHGDVLGFLPTYKNIDAACELIRRGVGESADVYALQASTAQGLKDAALRARRKGDRRKVVISTNLAETSLTVEGVRFVVDSGLIAQSEWDPVHVHKDIRTRPHSRSGIRQRWGRVGRKAPGWVFPLYTKAQYAGLVENTPPGSTRDNLESLVLTTRLGGIDDITAFPWPAAFEPTHTELDEASRRSMAVFRAELGRADQALAQRGAVDRDGHPTALGRELSRFQGNGSVGRALAIMYADRLACVPEVAAILCLLEDRPMLTAFADSVLTDSCSWPDEYRLDAALRHRGLAAFAQDEAQLALLVMAAWERADPDEAPWVDSEPRRRWCRQWYVGADVVAAAAEARRDIVDTLSSAMKEASKRFTEPVLLDRARLCISVGFREYRHLRVGDHYVPAAAAARPEPSALDRGVLCGRDLDDVIPVRRRIVRGGGPGEISGIVRAIRPQAWGAEEPTGAIPAATLLTTAARQCRPDLEYAAALDILTMYPVGQRVRLDAGDVVDVIVPFARDAQPAGRRLARLRQRLDVGEGTAADAAGELGAVGTRPVGDHDPEPTTESDRFAEPADSACGQCGACLSGRDADCRDRCEPEPAGAGRPTFAQWSGRFTVHPPRQPDLRLADGTRPSVGWYEVVGYERSRNGWRVLLDADWRPSTYVGDPAAQPGTASGDVAAVRVGPTTADHQGPVRLFYRIDRPGRFVLREAERGREQQEDFGQVAVSLDSGWTTQLAELATGAVFNATVIAARAPGCFTITLLEVLRKHVDLALTAPSGASTLPAVVHARPDGRGRLTVRLLHQDSRAGVRHHFCFPVSELPVGPIPEPGTPVLVRLDGARGVRLDVTGKPRSEVERICTSYSVRLDGDRRGGGAVLPGGAHLCPAAGTAVPRAAAEALAGLDDSAEWLNEVWTFWARTHHLQPDWSAGLALGTETGVREVLIPQRLDAHNGGDHVQQFDEFVEHYQEGSELSGVVARLTPSGAHIKIGRSLVGRLHIRNIAHFRIDHPESVLTVGDRVTVRVIGIDRVKRTVELSRKELTPEPYDYAKAACRRDDLVACVVRNVIDNRVFAELGAGIKGSIPRKDFAREPTAALTELVSRGDRLIARVKSFNDTHRSLDLTIAGVPADAEPTFVPVNNWIGAESDQTPTPTPPPEPPPAPEVPVPPRQQAPAKPAATRVFDVRDGCVVTDLGNGRLRIVADTGTTIEVDAAEYRSDARPLHWLRERGGPTG
ncbi:S1 RNA-binding domain-containing protein [Nocardia thailandica]|uniref:S1 RNA-binding domain-containing protein n=1 Tax=Nocardia thailandica TaxID=257275 RepID=A0ABW6PPF1_9NOCA